MIAAILAFLEAAAAIFLTVKAISAFNRMTVETCTGVSVAWVAIGGAAVSELIRLTLTHSVDWHTAFVVIAFAWMQLVERRGR